MHIAAIYYDGRQAKPHQVMLSMAGDNVKVQGGEIDRQERLSAVKIPAPLGSTPRLILFADGGRCEIADHQGFACVLPQHADSTVAGMENSWRYAMAGLMLTVVVLVASYLHALPYAAELAAKHIPAELLASMDEQFFSSLDQKLLHPSKLEPQRQQTIETALRQLSLPPGAVSPSRIEFRSSSQLGANAFALPGGSVLVLDELVALAAHDDDIVAVLAHEMGHITAKHALRQILQASVVGLVMTWYVGDVSTLLAAAPTLLLQTRYSREFESDADRFAMEVLNSNGISPGRLADMLQKLELAHRSKALQSSPESVSAVDYLSTHPSTEDRIKRLRGQR